MKRTVDYTDDVRGLTHPIFTLKQEDLEGLETLVASIHRTSFRILTHDTCRFCAISNGHLTIRDDYTGVEWMISYAFEDMEDGTGTLVAWSEEETSVWDGLGYGTDPSEVSWMAQYRALVEHIYRRCVAEYDQYADSDNDAAADMHRDRANVLESVYDFASARMVDHYDLPSVSRRLLEA